MLSTALLFKTFAKKLDVNALRAEVTAASDLLKKIHPEGHAPALKDVYPARLLDKYYLALKGKKK